ncbi:hypothetical protein SBP28_002324 [Candidozyma auris]
MCHSYQLLPPSSQNSDLMPSTELSRRSSELRRAETHLHELEAESLGDALPEGLHVSSESEKSYPAPKKVPLPTLITILNIFNGAIWGVLARRGLIDLTTYDGSFLGGVIWANFAACVVMGMFVASETVWEGVAGTVYANKGAVPFYVGVTTGFCGTCSSFSTFVLEIFNKAANTLTTHYKYPTAGYGVMEAMAVTIGQISVSVAGFHVGRHLVEVFDPRVPSLSPKTVHVLNYACCFLGIAAYIVDIVLLGTQNYGTWRSWLFSVLFAPWGALLRFFLSKKLNGIINDFPVGTFTANTLGCLLLAVFTVLARGRSSHFSKLPIASHINGCHVLLGLDDGFCGALTTVSTFVVELFGLKTFWSYTYGFTSVAVGFCIMVLIVGSYNWTVGLTSAVCQ